MQIPLNEDFNGARQDGVGVYQVTQKGGERWSSSRAYIESAVKRANLEVLTEVTAERVLFDEAVPGASPICRTARPR